MILTRYLDVCEQRVARHVCRYWRDVIGVLTPERKWATAFDYIGALLNRPVLGEWFGRVYMRTHGRHILHHAQRVSRLDVIKACMRYTTIPLYLSYRPAIDNDRLDVVEYVASQGTTLTADLPSRCVKRQRVDIMWWLDRNGCPRNY